MSHFQPVFGSGNKSHILGNKLKMSLLCSWHKKIVMKRNLKKPPGLMKGNTLYLRLECNNYTLNIERHTLRPVRLYTHVDVCSSPVFPKVLIDILKNILIYFLAKRYSQLSLAQRMGMGKLLAWFCPKATIQTYWHQ